MFEILRRLFSSKAHPRIESLDEMDQVEGRLRQLGYDISDFGLTVAKLNLESGYRPAETASYLALATLARDVRDAGDNILMLAAFLPHARTMIEVLTESRNANLIREDLFRNDVSAIVGVVTVDEKQNGWISRILSDPMIGGPRLATSRINYDKKIA